MNEHKYKRLITNFFQNELPDSVQYHFQKWFVREKGNVELDATLNDLFDDSVSPDQPQIDVSTHLVRFNQKYKKRATKRFPFLRTLYKVAAILLLPLLVGVFSHYYYTSGSDGEMQQISTRNGEQSIIHLPDGSTVWLNAGSTLIFPKKFKAKIRSIHLIGEGRFSVIKNKELPFVVHTNYQSVEALGTTFTVKAYSNSDYVFTSLEEGLLRLSSDSAQDYLLYPDQESIYDTQSGCYEIRRVDAVSLGQWYNGLLVFESVNLDEILKALSRQYNIEFIYDPLYNDSKVLNVKFNTNESLEQILDVLVGLTDYSGYKMYDNKVYLK